MCPRGHTHDRIGVLLHRLTANMDVVLRGARHAVKLSRELNWRSAFDIAVEGRFIIGGRGIGRKRDVPGTRHRVTISIGEAHA